MTTLLMVPGLMLVHALVTAAAYALAGWPAGAVAGFGSVPVALVAHRLLMTWPPSERRADSWKVDPSS